MAKNSGFGRAWRQAWNDGNDTFDWKGKKIAVVDKAGKRPPKRTKVNPSVPQATTGKLKEYEPSIKKTKPSISSGSPSKRVGGSSSSRMSDGEILEHMALPGPGYIPKKIKKMDRDELLYPTNAKTGKPAKEYGPKRKIREMRFY